MSITFSELYKDEKSKEMIKDFREKQVEVQSLLMQGKEAEPEKMEKLQSLYQILATDVKVKEFFDKEVEFLAGGEKWTAPCNCIVKNADAILCIKEFINNDSKLPTCIKWHNIVGE